MEVQLMAVLGVCAVLVVGLALVWRSYRQERRLRQLDQQEMYRLERELAVAEEKASRIGPLERELAERLEQLDVLRGLRADAERNWSTATEAASKIREMLHISVEKETEASRRIEALRDEVTALRSSYARVQESLEQERRQGVEKLALLTEAKEQLRQQFRLIAEEAMRTQGETVRQQNREQLEGLLSPLRDKLQEFQQGLQTAHTESSKDRATLAEQIRNLSENSARMSQEAHNLTRALKGKAQTQGAWGEMILSTILERSGLRKGEEYQTQESHMTEQGARLRPDVVVNLPNGERIIVDSKVSLTAFEAYVNADSDAERAACLGRHLLSLRSHIKALSGKEYHRTSGPGLDFVILFVPIEGALALALQEDPGLTGEAAESRVAIATPTTLMMALRTVASLWQVERRNQNADAIADRAGLLYDKFVGFITDMQKMGDQMNVLRKTYDNSMGKLAVGSGNLVRQAEMLKDLGARTSKALPSTLGAESE